MTLAAGQTLTHYEILGPLGAGAMGEVYRARDTRLEREVALKVLPEELSGDAERLRRFEREAKALASLNHPNVAQVYGIDQVGATCFMAMELVPGEDLKARLERGALAPAEALDVCRQIAAGVEAAHEAGVIHRDLKPANVVITPEGRVKVLDFGLAKPTALDGRQASAIDSVLTTEEGRLLGTPAYMAPEQARGLAIDKRVDVWAFGCLLYECLAGRRPFRGASLSDVLAAVLEREPGWSALPAGIPGGLRDLVARCLHKDVRQRLRDIGEARIALVDLAAPGGLDEDGRDGPLQGRGFLLATGAVALAAGFGAWVAFSRPPAEPPSRYVSVPLTASYSYRTNPNWSPNGEWLAFGRMESGSEDLYLRQVSSGHEQLRRAGPGDETGPAWSPDGGSIAFVATDLPGTPVLRADPYGENEYFVTETNMRVFDSASYHQALGDKPWSADGSTLLVSRVTEAGAIAVWRIGLFEPLEEQLTFPPVGSDDLGASYSFDHERIVFVRRGIGFSRLMLMPSDGGTPDVLLDDGLEIDHPAFRPDGDRIVFRGERHGENNLWQFSLSSRKAEQLTSLVVVWPGDLTVSADDRIAYSATRHDTILTTFDLETQHTEALTDYDGDNFGPRFSPDGRSIAYHSNRTGDREIWVRDLDGAEHRITRMPGNDIYPDWSPDGDRLVFISGRDGSPRIYVADRDGGDCHALVSAHGIAISPGAGGDSMSVRWSPRTEAGELVGFIVASDEGRTLWGIPPDGSEPARHLLDDVASFDWYLDCRRIIYSLDRGRAEELVVADLQTGETATLWTGPHAEIDVAPDGSAVMFCRGLGHLNMGLATLELVPPEEPGGLPSARGEPQDIVRPEGRWHVHHGGWAPDSKRVVYVHDADRANIYELVERR